MALEAQVRELEERVLSVTKSLESANELIKTNETLYLDEKKENENIIHTLNNDLLVKSTKMETNELKYIKELNTLKSELETKNNKILMLEETNSIQEEAIEELSMNNTENTKTNTNKYNELLNIKNDLQNENEMLTATIETMKENIILLQNQSNQPDIKSKENDLEIARLTDDLTTLRNEHDQEKYKLEEKIRKSRDQDE